MKNPEDVNYLQIVCKGELSGKKILLNPKPERPAYLCFVISIVRGGFFIFSLQHVEGKNLNWLSVVSIDVLPW